MHPVKKLSTLACTVAALSVALSGMAFAQDRRDDHRGDDQHGPGRPAAQRHDEPHGRADDGHGAGPDHAWRRGGRLPAEYRGRQYVVDDWRGHHLSAPPRGYHWVQSGPDYVLAAIATGIIAQVLLGH